DIRGSGSADGRVSISLVSPSIDLLPIVVRYSRPRGGPLPLGPFNVEGATTQSGVIWVVAGTDQPVRCVPAQPGRAAFDAAPRPLGEKKPAEDRDVAPEGAVAAFQYRSLAAAERADPRDPWFRLETDTVPGQLETSVTHTLRLDAASGRN